MLMVHLFSGDDEFATGGIAILRFLLSLHGPQQPVLIWEARKSPSPCAFSALILYSPNTPELEKNSITQQLGPSGC